MRNTNNMNEVFELYDIECNTCKNYDPMNGICQITGNNQHGYDFCEAMDTELNPMWEELEMKWDG